MRKLGLENGWLTLRVAERDLGYEIPKKIAAKKWQAGPDAEAGDVFLALSRAEPESVELTPLVERIQLSRDYSFEV